MSFRECIDYDLVRKETEEANSRDIEAENISEFNYLFETALQFADKNNISQDAVFTELKLAFKIYYPKCELLVSQGYKLEELRSSNGILVKDKYE